MALVFSKFYSLNQLARLKLGGNFSLTWDGSYSLTSEGAEPQPGSGITSGVIQLYQAGELPEPIQALLPSRGLLYILISTKYPILYVGITLSDLRKGIFGPGRFSHHARKLLAARGAGTNHTGGWIEHAVQRYSDLVRALEDGTATLDNIASHLSGDWRFAFAP